MKINNRIGIVIQVRSSSSRFKNKYKKNLGNKSIIKFLIDRILEFNFKFRLIIAIPFNDRLINLHLKNTKNIEIFKGSKSNVLDRYYKCSLKKNLNTIIRLTGDNPLIDLEILKKSIDKHIKYKKLFTTNCIENTFPNGLEFEIKERKLLHRAWKFSEKNSDKEHVTPYIYKLIREKRIPKKSILNIKNKRLKYRNIRLTIDKKKDLQVVRQVYDKLKKDKLELKFENIISIFKKYEKLFDPNSEEIRDEGYYLSIKND